MTQIDLGLVLAQPFFLCSLILFAGGWFISFIATCVIGNLIPLLWVDIFYNLFIMLGATLAVATNAVHNYRLVLLTFIGGSLTLLFNCINATISIHDLLNGSSRYSAAGAGFIFQSFVLIFWVVYFGAEEESIAKQTINGFTMPRANANSTNNPTTVGPTTIISPQPQHVQVNMNNHGSPMPGHAQQPQVNGQQNYGSVVVAPAADYAYKARALYSYEANPEDNNELSFTKGEILEIVDNKGKWWQARKPDGAVGIAPSNYLQLI
ncbi:Transmembrane osmosensor [Linnemannia hyalina]|uniref:Transmembrane osmosensor n=1 Tax=Linnemannia hyalina TaxID=64524 RepID=A0A9P8BPA2_9FUNG|nr:Transmembrane osmosensor [Linnemannia hyalina]